MTDKQVLEYGCWLKKMWPRLHELAPNYFPKLPESGQSEGNQGFEPSKPQETKD